jgi:TM2 domain-containing membrane protein YozV
MASDADQPDPAQNSPEAQIWATASSLDDANEKLRRLDQAQHPERFTRSTPRTDPGLSFPVGPAAGYSDPYQTYDQYSQPPYPRQSFSSYQNQRYTYEPYPMPYEPGYLERPHKSRVVAGVLGILLGAFGVHNFYLGHLGRAKVQLLVSLLSFGSLAWLMGIWGVVEGIQTLVAQPGDDHYYDGHGAPLDG